jgi:hypothetical protein
MDSNTQIRGNLVSGFIDSNQEFVTVLETAIKEYKEKKSIKNVPLSIFSKDLGILEATVKYLKENTSLSYHEIAVLLNRDDRTIWATYNRATHKHKALFELSSGDSVDPAIFSNRNQAPLEALVKHLAMRKMTLKQISLALNRSYKTIWLTNRK